MSEDFSDFGKEYTVSIQGCDEEGRPSEFDIITLHFDHNNGNSIKW